MSEQQAPAPQEQQAQPEQQVAREETNPTKEVAPEPTSQSGQDSKKRKADEDVTPEDTKREF